MIALLDNTVLSNFALTQQISLLKDVFGLTAAIPTQVMAEFEQGVQLGRLPMISWEWASILTLSIEEQKQYQQLLGQLGAGEASCLAIAIHRDGSIVYTDDYRARLLAKQLSVPMSGTLGILIRLVKRNQLSLVDADTILSQMITQGYHAPVDTLKHLL